VTLRRFGAGCGAGCEGLRACIARKSDGESQPGRIALRDCISLEKMR